MAASDINLTVRADLANLQQQLQSVQGMTAEEARRMVAAVNQSIRAAERASRESAAAARRALQETQRAAETAESAGQQMADSFGRASNHAQKFGGVVGMISPELGAVLGVVDELAGSLEDMGDITDISAAGMGALGIALIAAAAALQIYLEAGRDAEEITRIQTEATNEYIRALEERAALDVEYEVITGRISDTEGERVKLLTEQQKQFEAVNTKYYDQISALKENIYWNEKLGESANLPVADQVIYGLRVTAQSMGFLGDTTQTANQKISALNQGLIQEREALALVHEQELENFDLKERAKVEREAEIERTKRAAAAQKAAAEAAKAAAAAEKEREAAAKALADRIAGYAASLRDLEKAQLATATQEEKILAAGDERLRQIDEIEKKATEQALSFEEEIRAQEEAELARVAIRQDVQAQIDAIEAAAAAKRDELRKAEAAKEQAAVEERAALLTDALGQGFDTVRGLLEEGAAQSAEKVAALQQQLEQGAENLSQAEREALKQRVEAQRAAAIRAFEVAKAGKLAEAIINTATAVTANLANPVAAGIVAAIGAAQVATISAEQPAFHSGGMVGGPDQVGARLVAGEGVLSRQGVSSIGGPEAVRAANAGVSQAPMVVAVSQYRHEIFRPFIRDHLKLGGALADTIRGSRTIGMREAL